MEKKRSALRKPGERITVRTLHNLKTGEENQEKGPLTALSIYDYAFASRADKAGVDMIIIGDSLGNTVMGYGNTLPVTMSEMITFATAACRGANGMFTVGDMPLGSYQACDQDAVNNAVRFIKEAGCAAVKCEASEKLMTRFQAIANAEILVMGHIGLNPQKIHEMGGHRIQGKTVEGAAVLRRTAIQLENSGAFAILVEGVTEEVTGIIRDSVKIPVYGIGSGRKVDGQLLIGHDPLDLYDWGKRPVPKYIKQFKPLNDGTKTIGQLIVEALRMYVGEVKNGEFPGENHVHHVPDDFDNHQPQTSEEEEILKLLRHHVDSREKLRAS